tara:strand:+ start:229 stop:822 length:594 start_codon:yes stop_codon:yes gene_type:complete
MWVGRQKIIPMSFKIPRKTRRFVPAFYPDEFAGIPAQEGADWLKGSNKPPVLTPLDPKKKDSGTGRKRTNSAFTIAKSRAELERELASALEEIQKVEKMKKDLLAKLAAAGIEPEKVDESKLPPPPPEPTKTVAPARPVRIFFVYDTVPLTFAHTHTHTFTLVNIRHERRNRKRWRKNPSPNQPQQRSIQVRNLMSW